MITLMFSSAVEIPREAKRSNAFHLSLVQRPGKKTSFVQKTHQIQIARLDVCGERTNYYFIPLNLTLAAEFY